MVQAEAYATPKTIKIAPSIVFNIPGGKFRLKASIQGKHYVVQTLNLHPSKLCYLVFAIPTYFLIYKIKIIFNLKNCAYTYSPWAYQLIC